MNITIPVSISTEELSAQRLLTEGHGGYQAIDEDKLFRLAKECLSAEADEV